ncbi:MAG: hypothetical protein JJE51_11885 [Thermoanaerobaculia bacterium]|nr:hypothetical protein [Thermoanaerobaculia bacterium]
MNAFALDRYLLRRKFFSMIHTDFFIEDNSGNTVLWGRKKGFKLKEDIRLFADAAMQNEVIAIAARSVLDFSGTYDVTDSQLRTRIGSVRRKGLRSLLRDEWHILGSAEEQIAIIQEDSQVLALVRRFLTELVPQSFHVLIGGTPVAEFKQHFNPFRFRLGIDFSLDARQQLDRRLGLAAATLVGTIEGRQND